MLEVILKGILVGILVSLSTGPIFFMMIDITINKGFIKGFFFTSGAFISDIVIVLILFTGSFAFFTTALKDPLVKFAGGILFVLFGIAYYFSGKFKLKYRSYTRIEFFKGFLINILNPTVTVFWITIVTLAISDFSSRKFYHLLFFIIVFGIMFVMNIVKVLAARKLKRYTTDRHLLILNRVTSSVLILFGLFLIGQYIRIIYFA